MAYSELIKNFSKIREYMRQFYVYGFRSRSEFDMKSARGYDNERRRVESWLSEYMRFRQEDDGKIVFMSIDSRIKSHNPLYEAFKTKSFTDNDITFHFYILDILQDGQEYTVSQILDLFDSEYLFGFENAKGFDESNVRKKIKEYVKLGIIKERKQGRDVYLSLCESRVPLSCWDDAVDFFCEESPLGVIGSFIRDRQEHESLFRFKHRYIFSALDSDIVYNLLLAVAESRDVKVTIRKKSGPAETDVHLTPLKIYISTQSGRQYLLCHNHNSGKTAFVRVDNIESVALSEKSEKTGEFTKESEKLKRNLWGVALGDGETLDEVRMTIHINDDEEYIYRRLQREKRSGKVSRRDKNTCEFQAEVFDAREMLPFIRTFFGRIEEFYCSNPVVTERLREDMRKLTEYYGGESDAV